jgi:hypothetical protein
MKNIATGLSIGRTADKTGLAVVETIQPFRSDLKSGPETLHFHVRELHSFPPGTKLTVIVEYLTTVMRMAGDGYIIVDQTEVREPYVKMIEKDLGREVCAAIIAGQHHASEVNCVVHIPKPLLVSEIRALFEKERLKIFKDLPEANNLIQELLHFENQPTTAASSSVDAWRERPSDHLLLATGLACWKLRNPPVDFYTGLL